MKVLVTGGNGMLGRDLVEKLSGDLDVLAPTVDELDIRHDNYLPDYLWTHRPDVVIHCAAWTDVDGCEKDPQQAFAVNAQATASLARATDELAARFFYISTDYVFDGEKGLEEYHEWDVPNPINVYGMSKLAGEQLARHNCVQTTILRTQWLFGIHGKSFPRTILEKAAAGEKLFVVKDQYGCPTYTKDLARQIHTMLLYPRDGVYHASNGQKTSWHRFAMEILKEAGFETDLLYPSLTRDNPRAADRPKHSPLGCKMLTAMGMNVMGSWEKGLKEFVADWKKERA